MTRRALLAASVAAFVAAVTIAVTGGFVGSVGGVRVSARSSLPPFILGATLLVAWIISARRGNGLLSDLAWLGRTVESNGRRAAVAVSVCAGAVALTFATYSPSGADASGYLSQAHMWSRFETRVLDPLATLPAWPLPPAASAPLGWRPALDRGWQVPTYAPGLPWLMALPEGIAGVTGAVWVVAIAAVTAVWATSSLAFRIGGGGVAALFAALLLTTSPTFLLHAFQPMSDVPVTAAWAVCWWLVARASPIGAGLAAGAAVLVRPNLAPLAAVPLIVLMAGRDGRERVGAGVRFTAPVALAGALIGLMQWQWYGSPLTSGYGSPKELFSVTNVVPNVRLYGTWLWRAESPLVYIAIAAAVCGSTAIAMRGRRLHEPGHGWHRLVEEGSRYRIIAGLLTFAAGVLGAYLVYAVFEIWTYVRFLLPALAVLVSLSAAAIARALGRLPPAATGLAVVLLMLTAAATGVHNARSLGVFQTALATARVSQAAERLESGLGPRAVLLTAEQSGSMRYLTRRPVVRWDTLDAASLQAALAVLDQHGYEAWWVLDQFEESLVRQRFAGIADASLNRVPDVEAGPLMRTRAWRIPRRAID